MCMFVFIQLYEKHQKKIQKLTYYFRSFEKNKKNISKVKFYFGFYGKKVLYKQNTSFLLGKIVCLVILEKQYFVFILDFMQKKGTFLPFYKTKIFLIRLFYLPNYIFALKVSQKVRDSQAGVPGETFKPPALLVIG